MWVDLDDLHPASVWSSELQLAIEEANAFVFVISPDSVGSSECVNELEHAAVLNKRIIPLSYRRVDVAGLPEALARLQLLPPPQLGCFDDDFERWLQALVSAIDTDLEWVRAHTEWERRALEWQRHDHDRGFLLAGSELEAAEQWRDSGAGKQPLLTEEQTSFIRASREHATRRLRRTRAFVSAALVVAIGLSIAALILRAQAVANQRTAQSRQLAASAEANLGVDPQLSTQLALQALQIKYTTQAETALRDALPNDQLLHTLRQKAPIDAANFSPDGKLVVTASQDGTARIWNATTGQPTGITIAEPGGAALHDAEFGSNGKIIATASEDGTSRIWSVATGQPTGIVLGRPGGPALRVAEFTPSGRSLVTSGADALVRFWNLSTGKPTATVRQPGGAGLTAMSLSRDGVLLVTASTDGRARVWNANTGRPAGVTITAPIGTEFNDAQFSPNGSDIVTADTGGVARLWDTLAGNSTGVTITETGGSALNGATFSPDGGLIVTAGQDADARVWDDIGQPVALLAGHTGSVNSAAISSQQPALVVTTGIDGTARIWAAGPRERKLAFTDPNAALTQAALSPDAKLLAIVDNLGVRMLDAKTGQLMKASIPAPAGGSFNDAEFSPDGKLILTADGAGNGRIWSVATGMPSGVVLSDPARSSLAAAAFGAGGSRIVTLNEANIVRSWDARTGRPLGPPVTEPGGARISDAAFSPDGRDIVTASRDSTARVWDVARGKQIGIPLREPDGGWIQSAVFSSNGKLILTASSGGTIRIWDVATGRTSGAAIVDPASNFSSANFSPDGSLILEQGQTSVRIWDEATRKLLVSLDGNGLLNSAVFGATARTVVTAGVDGTVGIWSTELANPLPAVMRIAAARAQRQLTPAERKLYPGG